MPTYVSLFYYECYLATSSWSSVHSSARYILMDATELLVMKQAL